MSSSLPALTHLEVVDVTGQDGDTLRRVSNEFRKISPAEVIRRKSEAAAVGRWSEGLPVLPGGFQWNRGALNIWERTSHIILL